MTYRNLPYQIGAFFVDSKIPIKINNLIMVHWLNILSKRGGVKTQMTYNFILNAGFNYVNCYSNLYIVRPT